MPRRTVLIIADGMADSPGRPGILDGRTPLEAASMPSLRSLLPRAMVGTCRTIPHGMAPGSDVGNMALLGYDPLQFHTGRGPVEAVARGLDVGPEDLVWRLNLVRLDSCGEQENRPSAPQTTPGSPSSAKTHRAAVSDAAVQRSPQRRTERSECYTCCGSSPFRKPAPVPAFAENAVMRDFSAGQISTERAKACIRQLEDRLRDEEFSFHAGIGYRHLLLQRGGAPRPEADFSITPPHELTDRPIRDDYRCFSKSPRLLKLLAEASLILKAHDAPADAVWPWGQGKTLTLPDFREAFGLRGAVFAAVDLIRGLALAAGLEAPLIPGTTGRGDTDYRAKADAALNFLQTGNFACIHIQAPDECAHERDAEGKTEALQRIDRDIIGPVAESLGPDDLLIFTCDHPTPLDSGVHSADPVPFLLHGPAAPRTGNAPVFTEQSARKTGLHIEKAHTLLPWALSLSQRKEKR